MRIALFINKCCYIRSSYQHLINNLTRICHTEDYQHRYCPYKGDENCTGKGKELPPNKLAFSSKTIVRLQKFLPMFDHNFQLYRQALASQNKKGKDYNETLRKARIYLTHFIRIMNMAIFRGDLPGEQGHFMDSLQMNLQFPQLAPRTS